MLLHLADPVTGPAWLAAPVAGSEVRFLRRRDLRAQGWTDRALRAAVDAGRLLRPRASAYLSPDTQDDLVMACGLGGRLACVSELDRRGVFVLEQPELHLHLHERRTGAKPPTKSERKVRRHWGRLHRTPHPCATSVEVFDALLQALCCQAPRAAVATLDSALHLGLLHPDDLDELFRILPARYRVMRRLVDRRAESGPESLLRLMLRALGASFDIQVTISGVGRVDFVVDGWLIVECDSQAHHASWDQQRRDRRRDQAAAALGYATYRPIAEDIMWHPEVVQAALRGLLGSRRGGTSGGRRRGV